LVPYDPIMVELGPKGGCAVGLDDMSDEPFFQL